MSGRSRRDAPRARPRTEPLYPRLRASKNASRERVIEDQRARLHGAIAEAVRRHGYKDAHVDEVVALAGVSTSTLYSIYGGKLRCFLGAYDAFVDQTARAVLEACRDGSTAGASAGLEASVGRLLQEISRHPAPAQLMLAEGVVLGDGARASTERAEVLFAGMLERGLARMHGERPPAPLLIGIVHGIWSLARRSLLEGRAGALTEAETREQIVTWIRGYPRPGLQRLFSTPAGIRRLSGGEGRTAPTDEQARIVAATAALAARFGRERLSLARIAQEAGVSRRRLAASCDSVDACVLAAAEVLSARALARALQRAREASDWPRAVCATIGSFYGQAAADAAFARVCFSEVLLTGPDCAKRRGALLTGFARLLASRAPRDGVPSPIVAELIVGGVWGIAHRAVRRGGSALASGRCSLGLLPRACASARWRGSASHCCWVGKALRRRPAGAQEVKPSRRGRRLHADRLGWRTWRESEGSVKLEWTADRFADYGMSHRVRPTWSLGECVAMRGEDA